MNIIIFGPPLAGKGTQSDQIIQNLGVTHLSTGDALRAEKQQKTALGIKAAEFSDKGLFAPDDLVAEIVVKFYHNHKEDTGILFDGYPRNVDQAKHLLNVIESDGNTIDTIIYLKVPKEALLQRAIKRAEEQNRADDRDKSIVLNRIEQFENLTLPAIQYMKESGVRTIEIDGNQSKEIISKLIQEAIS